MTLKESIAKHLNAQSSITSLVGTRIYPIALPQQHSLPAVTFRVISGVTPGTMTGSSKLRLNVRLEFTSWSSTSKQADQIILAIRLLMQSFQGYLGGDGTFISVHQVMGPRDMFDPVTRLYGSQIDLMTTVDEDSES